MTSPASHASPTIRSIPMEVINVRKTILATLATALLLTAGCASNNTQGENMNTTNKEKAVALLYAIETGNQAAIGHINAQSYTQHNLTIGDGLAGFGAVLQALPKGSAKVSIARAFQDGDYVFTHTDYNFFGPKVGFDLFRFEDGLIVEHWDNLDVKADKPNPSGHTQLDGTTAIVDLNKTAANKALVSSF